MIRGNKLYINITNHCDVCCPFCCMKSDSKKQSFMNFDTIHKIMKDMDVPYIVQLEGGEPTKSRRLVPILRLIEKYGYRKRTLTTNGSGLFDIVEGKPILQHITDNHFQHLNISKAHFDVYDTILMIGDASGKEGQFSDSDKKTAENFGCEYMDVDDFVYKYNNR